MMKGSFLFFLSFNLFSISTVFSRSINKTHYNVLANTKYAPDDLICTIDNSLKYANCYICRRPHIENEAVDFMLEFFSSNELFERNSLLPVPQNKLIVRDGVEYFTHYDKGNICYIKK